MGRCCACCADDEDPDDLRDAQNGLAPPPLPPPQGIDGAGRQRLTELPATQASAREIERIQEEAINSRSGLAIDAQEFLTERKTAILEGAIGTMVAESDNAKLAPLQGLPPGDYWRLLIDGKEHGRENKHCYDRSCGYMAGMMSGLEHIVEHIDDELSVDFIKDLHMKMSRHVTTEAGSNDARRSEGAIGLTRNKFQEQGLKKVSNAWGTCFERTEEGLQELTAIRDDLTEVVPDYFGVPEIKQLTKANVTRDVPEIPAARGMEGEGLPAVVTQLMNHAIQTYQNAIGAANNEDDRLDAIIDCCRALGQIHPFKDANGRVLMFGVLNKLLLENQLNPTILNDQGLMIGLSRGDLRTRIREGQVAVENLKQH